MKSLPGLGRWLQILKKEQKEAVFSVLFVCFFSHTWVATCAWIDHKWSRYMTTKLAKFFRQQNAVFDK